MDWVTYITNEEKANYGICFSHRKKKDLPTENLEDLDCEKEICYKDCPFSVGLK